MLISLQCSEPAVTVEGLRGVGEAEQVRSDEESEGEKAKGQRRMSLERNANPPKQYTVIGGKAFLP